MSENKPYTVGSIVNLGGTVSPEVRMYSGDVPEQILPLGALKDLKIGIATYSPGSVKGRIIEYLNKQTEKGVAKYGHTLDQCPDDKHDWRLMMIEELIDCIQYQQKEIQRLERLLTPNDESNG